MYIDKTVTWCYDVSGNILSRTEYAYTTGAVGTPTNTFAYTYDTGWKDQLVSFNGQSIAYDDAGNPTTYKGATLTWTRGRLLASYTPSGSIYTTTMQYDADGRRCRKTIPTSSQPNIFSYIYNGNNLIRETKSGASSYTKTFLYNSQGIIGFVYNGTTYMYRKNLFGDIVAIYQGATKVAEYAYDAWGNQKVMNGNSIEVTDLTHIAHVNPFRYRGYYWDNDLGLYYLMSRYYDPQTGRFINADSLEYLDPETIGGLNLYAYCGNNPVMHSDPSGYIALWLLALIGVVASGVINGISNMMSASDEENLWGAFLGGFVEGALSSVALAVGLSIGSLTGGAGLAIVGGIVATVGGFGAGVLGNAVSQKISYGNVDWGVACINGAWAAITNFTSYLGLVASPEILSTASNFGKRILENMAPSSVGLGITTWFSSLPKPNFNEWRNIEK